MKRRKGARQAKTVTGRATKIMNTPTAPPRSSTSGWSSSLLLTKSPSVRNMMICMSHVKPSKKTVSVRFWAILWLPTTSPER